MSSLLLHEPIAAKTFGPLVEQQLQSLLQESEDALRRLNQAYRELLDGFLTDRAAERCDALWDYINRLAALMEQRDRVGISKEQQLNDWVGHQQALAQRPPEIRELGPTYELRSEFWSRYLDVAQQVEGALNARHMRRTKEEWEALYVKRCHPLVLDEVSRTYGGLSAGLREAITDASRYVKRCDERFLEEMWRIIDILNELRRIWSGRKLVSSGIDLTRHPLWREIDELVREASRKIFELQEEWRRRCGPIPSTRPSTRSQDGGGSGGGTEGAPPTPPSPPETGSRQPPDSDGTGLPPTPPPNPPGAPPAEQARFCCERCPGTDEFRMYFPLPPDTDCQPGDVRRDGLPYPQCPGNVLVDPDAGPSPPTYGEACCAKKTAQLLYDSTQSGDVASEVGSVLRAACADDPCAGRATAPATGAPTRLETSILSTGTDVQGRNWVPENPVLRLGKERLKPCHTEPFYVAKEAATNAAAVVLGAISADYADDARAAEASKGTSCHASEGSGSAKRTTPQERAAKAAAIGLLASQAKGQVEGLRATFDVTGREAKLNDAKLQADIVNEVTQKKVPMNLPVRFEPDEAQRR